MVDKDILAAHELKMALVGMHDVGRLGGCKMTSMPWTGQTWIAGLIAMLGLAWPAVAQPLPEGLGFSAKYPSDQNIAKDPAVLFADDFETGTVAQIGKRWGNLSNKPSGTVELDGAVPVVSGGKRSIKMTAMMGQNTGGHLYASFKDGVEKMHARFYVKFARPGGYIHHFVHAGGYHPPTRWPQGGAGEKPKGDDRITVGIEPYGDGGRLKPPGAWNFYAYWHEMKVSAGGKYWGNGLHPAAPQTVPAGQWQCVEMMIKLNTPNRHDGELALWLDGKLAGHFKKGSPRGPWTGMGFHLKEKGGEPFEGFRWRTDPKLKLNFFWLLHYVTDSALKRNKVADLPKTNTVWFDHVVVAKKYIGPLAKPRP